jgi:TetR/AcrR family transcriptional regulator, cholesterol catabolism regulator
MSSTSVPRRVRNKLDKRTRIQAAAFELFSEKGFEATTTKAIADAAGVAAGTIFLYAQDKSDLLMLAMRDELARVVEERFAAMPEAPLLEQLLHVFAGLLAFYEAHPKVAVAFVQTLVAHHGPNAAEMDRLTIDTLGRMAGLVHGAIERGELVADVPPLLLAQNCFALYFSSLTAWLRGYAPTAVDATALLRIALELQLRGLRR